MTQFDIIKSLSIDELTEWLNKHGSVNNAPWLDWWDSAYCNQCEGEECFVVDWKKKMKFRYCEFYEKCRFFPEQEEIPGIKAIIKMWLESEGEVNGADM